MLATLSEKQEEEERYARLERMFGEVCNERDRAMDRVQFLESNAASERNSEDEDKQNMPMQNTNF